jgi:hypothetical protein
MLGEPLPVQLLDLMVDFMSLGLVGMAEIRVVLANMDVQLPVAFDGYSISHDCKLGDRGTNIIAWPQPRLQSRRMIESPISFSMRSPYQVRLAARSRSGSHKEYGNYPPNVLNEVLTLTDYCPSQVMQHGEDSFNGIVYSPAAPCRSMKQNRQTLTDCKTGC